LSEDEFGLKEASAILEIQRLIKEIEKHRSGNPCADPKPRIPPPKSLIEIEAEMHQKGQHPPWEPLPKKPKLMSEVIDLTPTPQPPKKVPIVNLCEDLNLSDSTSDSSGSSSSCSSSTGSPTNSPPASRSPTPPPRVEELPEDLPEIKEEVATAFTEEQSVTPSLCCYKDGCPHNNVPLVVSNQPTTSSNPNITASTITYNNCSFINNVDNSQNYSQQNFNNCYGQYVESHTPVQDETHEEKNPPTILWRL